ncbi:Six-hairpin glycosidase-like protein [Aspergillus cavernicola]|uniref:Six-hairpin glycosidase-like protein n=1 Tax=Aspergillus cavernicola TaxID=176166 RepID=A0ABR4HGA9_9EURO
MANSHSPSAPAHSQTKRAKTITQEAVVAQPLRDTLYSESVVVKLWNVARKALGSAEPPVLYPEYTGNDGGYVYRHLDFWTSGFFPGSLYLLLERQVRYPRYYIPQNKPALHGLQLQHLCQWWSTNLHPNAAKKNTHDLGFMIAPWAIKAWTLHRDPQAYSSLVLAAHSLAGRYDARVQSIRSWDVCQTKRYSFADPSKDFLVIIDNMLNLDLLFWVACETRDHSLHDIAVAHARTTKKHHIRSDNSTVHVVNYDAETGHPRSKFTHQGYSDNSCWSRGQAWGILGFMQTYEWTRDSEFLDTAKGLADYFLSCLPEDGVPYWDFDAPVNTGCPRDTSAGMVACCGLVLLYKALKDTDFTAARSYLDSALTILEGTVSGFMTPSPARFDVDTTGIDHPTFPENEPQKQPGTLVVSLKETTGGVRGSYTVKCPETILDGATVCNYEFASRRWADHGLVYADYYFLLLGNMLLEMGLVSEIC